MASGGSPLVFCYVLAIIITCSVLNVVSTTVVRPNSSFTPQQSNGFWMSGNRTFTFGFKEVATDQYALCIWYSKDDNKTTVWWANYGGDSLTDGSAVLNFTDTGNLELLDSSRAMVWSSNSSNLSVSSAQLLDTGNLILITHTDSILWQSFGNLTDTLLLPNEGGLNISSEQHPGRPYFLQSRENSTSYMLGDFNLQISDPNLSLQQFIKRFNYDFTFWYGQINTTGNVQIQEDNKAGILYDNNNYKGDHSVRRLTLDYDGHLRVYSWGANSTSWEQLWTAVDDICQIGSPCGAFGLCTVINSRSNCTCPPGYNAIDSHDPTQGCYSEVSFNASCSSNSTTGDAKVNYTTTMVKVVGYDYNQDDLLPYSETPVVDENKCQSLCKENCTCMAASYKTDSTNRCFLKGNSKTGVLLEGSADASNDLFVKVVTAVAVAQGSSKVWVAVGVGVATVVVVSMAGGVGWWFWRQKCSAGGWMAPEEEDYDFSGGPTRFTYAQLAQATNNFRETLGEGGFGKVYKGWLAGNEEIGGGTKVVAVKLLKGTHWQAVETEKQFRAELRTLGKIHHINLVDLLGFCTDSGRWLLVYEYLEKGSLDNFLFVPATGAAASAMSLSSTSSSSLLPFTPTAVPLLPWPTRFSIALGTARGISYLHHECHEGILHCDIKPQNILLDADFHPKVADFGFARQFHHRNDHLVMSGVRGTRGYLAPEWLGSEEISSKADVFSFGIVLLEISRGLSNDIDKWQLRDWAFQCVSNAAISTSADVARMELQEPADVVQVPDTMETQELLRLLKVGLWCIQRHPSMRPTMSYVVQMLGGTLSVADPPYPAPLNPPASTFTSISENPASSLYSLLSPR